jgi:hypothetical protein
VRCVTGRRFLGLPSATGIDEQAEGVVGVRRVGNAAPRIADCPTGGAEPHDIRPTPDGRRGSLSLAGIRTDPRLPRARLDLHSVIHCHRSCCRHCSSG